MGRTVGLDYGEARIGVAVSDPLGCIAQPVGNIDARGDVPTQFRELCAQFTVDRIVVGLPRHMSGDEGDSAKKARELGEMLGDEFGIEVVYLDERLTSAAAERMLIEADMSRRKRRGKIDRVAAAMILQNYLDSQIG